MEIVIASHHSGTIYELKNGLKELLPQPSVLSLFDFPKKTFTTLLQLACEIKSIVISESSQLYVPKLNEEFPLLSDSVSIDTKKLLTRMGPYSDEERFAQITATIFLATPSGHTFQATQRMEGFLSDEERGSLTFAYDTLFIKHDYIKTLGELDPSTRIRISPRIKALSKLLPHFRMA